MFPFFNFVLPVFACISFIISSYLWPQVAVAITVAQYLKKNKQQQISFKNWLIMQKKVVVIRLKVFDFLKF